MAERNLLGTCRGNRRFTILSILLLIGPLLYGQSYTITAFNYDFCEASYPMATYQTGSFSLCSTAGGIFEKNKNNKTFTVVLDAGFEFKTAATTADVTVNGNYLSRDSWTFDNANSVTIQYDAANDGASTDCINFSNFEIRAIAAGTGYMYRSGGDAKFGSAPASAAKPATTEYFGTFTAASPGVISSSTVAQASTADVEQYSVNNQILSININTSSGGCDANISQFVFSTGGTPGTDLTTNIINAKVYYTGTSSVFATTSLYGNMASPNGAFTVSGAQTLGTGDNYFWLVYDVPGDANTSAGSNEIDASLTSYTFEGVVKSGVDLTTPDPAGSRTIIPATEYHSIAPGNWTTAGTWSATNGGASCGCSPSGSGVAYMYHAVSLDADRTVDVVEIQSGGVLSGNKVLTANTLVKTLGTGVFTMTKEMIAYSMELSGTGASTNTKKITLSGDLTVGSGTSLTMSGAGGGEGEALYVGGNLTVDGDLTHSAMSIYMNGTGALNLSGTGNITSTGDFTIRNGNRNITSGSSLNITGNLLIEGAIAVTNSATLTISGTIDGDNAASSFTNANGGTLNFGGASVFASNGTFNANAATNTVNLTAATANIPVPSSSQYNNLTISAGTKTQTANINVSGNFQNDGTYAHGNFGITANGSSGQIFSGTSTSPLYNLTVSNASGITLNNAVTMANTLTFSSGIVTIGTGSLTINSGAGVAGASSSSHVNGSITKLGNQDFIFPVGNGTSMGEIGIANFAAGDATSSMSASYTPGTPANGASLSGGLDHISSVEYWDLTHSGGTAPTLDVTLYWASSTFSGTAIVAPATSADLVVAHYNGATWENYGQGAGVSTGASGSVSASSVSAFSPFTFGSTAPAITLPVELINFTVNKNPAGNLIEWTTASEVNNDFFELQRSNDGRNFETITTVQGKGNSYSKHNYSFIDNPSSNSNYYRLKQVDFNGDFSYSPIRHLASTLTNFSFSIFPNPTAPGDFVVFEVAAIENNTGKLVFTINDMKGLLIKTIPIDVPHNGKTTKTILPLDLPKGIYFVSIDVNNSRYIQKLIVQ